MNGLNIIEDKEYEYMEEISTKEGFFQVEKNGKYGIIDKGRNIIIPLFYDDYLMCSENGYITAYKNDKCGIIDFNNNVIVPFEYESIREDFPKCIIAKKNGKYGFIDIHNKQLTEFKYDDLLTFNGFENYIAKLGDKFGIVDKNLNIINDFIYSNWSLVGDTLTLIEKSLEIKLK